MSLPVDVDGTGPTAPPRRNGELVFDAPWQARAFALCIAIMEREGLDWAAFRRHLVPAIESTPDAPYYEQFVVALSAFAGELGLVAETELP